MGDEAEGIFENWAAIQGIGWHRFGINRPPFDVKKLPLKLRYTPDYMGADFLYEVQGFGKDQKVKVKEEKLQALLEWNYDHPTVLWLYNNVNETCLTVGIKELVIASLDAESKMFPEGKHYFEWDANYFNGWKAWNEQE